VAFAARNGGKVRDLFEGRWQTYFPASAGPSEADLALCSELAFWTGPDAARIDRLFRQSALFRDKWDDVHDGEGRTYGEMTIAAALASKADFYNWSRKEKQAAPPPMVELGSFRLLPRTTRETAGGKIVVGVDVLRDGEVVHFLNASSSTNGRKDAVRDLLRFLPGDQQEVAVAERAVDEVLVLGRKQMLEAPKGRTGNTIIDLLLVEVPRRWKLTHRDQQGLWSETLGRSVNRSTLLELVVCSEILSQAAECADALQDARGEVQLDKLQALVEKLAKVVYADLVGLLPPLERAEISENSGTRIRQALKTAILDAWMRPQIMGIVRRQTTDNDSVQLADRTSLAQRVRKEAFHIGVAGNLEICGPLAWSQVQSSHSAWWRVFQPAEGPPQVWLAMRFDLFPATHINLASYGIYDQASLTSIGRKLGLLATAPPVPETIGHQKTRVAVLAADLVPEIVFDTSEESRPAGAKRPAPAA
jgi:hypothetical protein